MIELLPWQGSVVVFIPLYPHRWGEPPLDGPYHVWTSHHLSGPKV